MSNLRETVKIFETTPSNSPRKLRIQDSLAPENYKVFRSKQNDNSTQSDVTTSANNETSNDETKVDVPQNMPQVIPPAELTEYDLRAMCFEYRCEDNILSVLIMGNLYRCDGQEPLKIQGASGHIICPPAKLLCGEKFLCKFGCVDKYKNSS